MIPTTLNNDAMSRGGIQGVNKALGQTQEFDTLMRQPIKNPSQKLPGSINSGLNLQ